MNCPQCRKKYRSSDRTDLACIIVFGLCETCLDLLKEHKETPKRFYASKKHLKEMIRIYKKYKHESLS